MHELSLIEAIASRISTDAIGRGFTRVVQVRVAVGQLSGVLPHALEFAWQIVAQQPGPLAEAQLKLERRAVQARCPRCGRVTEWAGPAETPADGLAAYGRGTRRRLSAVGGRRQGGGCGRVARVTKADRSDLSDRLGGGVRLRLEPEIALDLDHCPACGAGPLELIRGTELLILGYEAQ